jgi:hypothetical protein
MQCLMIQLVYLGFHHGRVLPKIKEDGLYDDTMSKIVKWDLDLVSLFNHYYGSYK